ncbi:PREDICTED: uncharacterized protein LOC105364391 [Ceratosolen solmsi marchali]|uniref:Uncharacterized protein LOC105364391 n=1 Tax=Ceratosolen solmsi marchali TaxID=326594 RepID=A0AAJ6YM56_9HYME|nr:PREDICTED: uncharacterized protein LOC105364391 [Ceratosolen solmsi marchali]
MIALLWSFLLLLSMLLASSQAFLTAPVPGYAHGLTTYTSAMKHSMEKSRQTAASELEDARLDEAEREESAIEHHHRQQQQPSASDRRGEEQTVYVIEFETEEDGKGESRRNRGGKDMNDESSDGQSPLDPWSIVWYIGSFGGLVAFFLIVSCSEWCCRRGARPLSVPYTQRGEVMSPGVQPAGESPPPPYHLFAPPPYDSVNYAEIASDKGPAPEKLDIYVISLPIHQGQQPPA